MDDEERLAGLDVEIRRLLAEHAALLRLLAAVTRERDDLAVGMSAVRRCPMDHEPNAETAAVIRDARHGRNLLGPYGDTEEMFRDMGI